MGAYKQMNIAIIPARGGSKRIPKKKYKNVLWETYYFLFNKSR